MFPTLEPSRLSPDSTLTAQVELSKATEVHKVGVDEIDERVEE
jgi:hypothetical protein